MYKKRVFHVISTFPFRVANGFQSRYTNHLKTFFIDTSTRLLLFRKYIILSIQIHIIQYICALCRHQDSGILFAYYIGIGNDGNVVYYIFFQWAAEEKYSIPISFQQQYFSFLSYIPLLQTLICFDRSVCLLSYEYNFSPRGV